MISRLFKSYRGQLIIGLSLTVIFILISQFYIFIAASRLNQFTAGGVVSGQNLDQLRNGIDGLAGSSFIIFAVTLLFISGFLIYLVFVLNASLREILKGINSMERGDLSYRVKLNSNNEFGTLAKFFNQATANVEGLVNQRTVQLAAERNKLEVILSGINDGVVALDRDRKIISANKTAIALFGSDQIIGRNIEEVLGLYEEGREINHQQYAYSRGAFEGVLYSHKLLEFRSKFSQKTSFVSLVSSQILEGEAVNLGCILSIHDLTHEQQLEAMKVDFVSMAAHELRTPLTAVQGFLDLMVDGKESLSPKYASYARKALASANDLAELVSNLLSVSKIERDAMTLRLDKLDLKEQIDYSIREQRSAAEVKKVHVSYRAPAEPTWILGDKIAIREVANNLLANAIHYTPAGGSVTITTRREDQSVITDVSDTGIGIPPSDLPNLFSKFYRVHGGLASGSKGTGLGLFITKSIVQMHGGSVGVRSEEGKGSTFTYKLPGFNQAKYEQVLEQRKFQDERSNIGWITNNSTGRG